jgi:hypothetical protein
VFFSSSFLPPSWLSFLLLFLRFLWNNHLHH